MVPLIPSFRIFIQVKAPLLWRNRVVGAWGLKCRGRTVSAIFVFVQGVSAKKVGEVG